MPKETPGDVAAFAARSIAAGSKSFAAAARLFDRETRERVMMLYAWCRHCDDVVDGQEGGRGRVASSLTPVERIEGLRRDTHAALDGRLAELDPAFHALAAVAGRANLSPALLDEHLAGFADDVAGCRYRTLDELMVYCWRVAGVVGVMMAGIMGARDEGVLDRAADLGLAFQLTNIARDVVEDAAEGRVYLPLDWLAEEGVSPADLADPRHAANIARLRARLVAAAEPYYASARIGVDALPRRSAWAIATAERVYRRIGLKLTAAGEAAGDRRISTTKGEKFGAIAGAGWTALRFRDYGGSERDPALWRRPALG
ncbi:phytoene/squalene synthase family protein [Aureimonas pseudogalii]|uniref:Phytoene synthase n=1 Tax=Aureimonas pseudogalii TaxID=1744844 RepID=A0A7W6EEK4_9HYPH|nr:phytoene/squalene synthase family protein [Aureimonas pseudogalii]MBB3996793.1 phytoene synthase [Aureimonas pseudogalii]